MTDETTGLNRKLIYRALEPRMVFDGAAVATADAVIDATADPVDTAAAEQAQAEATQETNEFVAALGETQTRNEIAFVDSSVENIDALISELDPAIEIVVIDPDQDGLEQIAAALEGRDEIDAVHIIAHGEQGRLHLGNDTLDAASMQGEHLDELTAIGNALSADGDILIYGCDFTGGDAGLEAAILLGSITGADVAASTDLTGHAALGGDWELETEVGAIEAKTLQADEWKNTLAFNGLIQIPDDGGNDDVTQDPNDITALGVDYTNASTGQLQVIVQIDPTANTGSNTSNLAFVFDTDGDGNANYGFAISLGGSPTFEIEQFSLFYGKADNFAAKISGSQTTIGQWDSTSGWTTGSLNTTFGLDAVSEDPFDTSLDTRVTLNIDLNDILTHWQSLGNTSATFDDIRLLNATTQPSHSASSDPKDLGIDAAAPYNAAPDTATTLEDNAVTIDVASNDSSGLAPTSIQIATTPNNGTTSVNADGTITYTPNANYSGTDTFTYEIYGLDGQARTATVTVTVTPDADTPSISASNVTGNIGLPVGTTLTGALTDLDGSETLSSVTLTGVDPSLTFSSSAGTVTNLGGGTWEITQSALSALQVTGTTPGTYNISASVTATETANSDTAIAATSFTVTINAPPTATSSTSSGNEDTDIAVALSGTDSDGSVVSITVTALPPATEGVLYYADGSTPVSTTTPLTSTEAANLVFTPAENFNGVVTIPFTVTDDDGATSTPANEVISVIDVNDPPTATPSTSSGNEDTDIAVALAGADVDGTIASVNVTTLPPASEGILYYADGSTPVSTTTPLTPTEAANLVFTPADNFNGTVTVSFTVTDDDGATSAPANEVITVAAVNDPPVAVFDSATTVPGAITNIDVLANDSDIDGGTLFVSGIYDPANPTNLLPISLGSPVTLASGTQIELLADGTLNVTQGHGAGDQETFDYQVSDGAGGLTRANVTLNTDSDGDGIANFSDIDDDNDGILDIHERPGSSTGPTTTTLTYDAAASAAASQVNGQPVIILTDGTVTITISNDLGASISGSAVTTNSSSGTAESVRITATSATGTVLINALSFDDLDNFDPNFYVDAIALDQAGTWSGLTNSDGTNALVAYSNDTAGETAAATATAETVSFSDLRTRGAVSDVLLNPTSSVENNYQATFTLDDATETALIYRGIAFEN